MKSWAERIEGLRKDPEKFRKTFNAIWIIAYGMLFLGLLIMVWVLYQEI